MAPPMPHPFGTGESVLKPRPTAPNPQSRERRRQTQPFALGAASKVEAPQAERIAMEETVSTTMAELPQADPMPGSAGEAGASAGDGSAGAGPSSVEAQAPTASAADAIHSAFGSKDEVDPLSAPAHGCEVFVGGLPRAAQAAQVEAWASQVGPVHSVSLRADPQHPGQSKGYGFVTFKSRDSASQALSRLGNEELPGFPGLRPRVQPSAAKNKLYVGGLPPGMSQGEVLAALQELVRGVEGVELLMQRSNASLSRGFAFVEFYNAAAAGLAKARLQDPETRVGDRRVSVDYADREAAGGREAHGAGGAPGPSQPQIRSVFVGNLPLDVDEAALREVFQKHGAIERVHLSRSREGDDRRYGFVHFVEAAAAKAAVKDPEPPVVGGNKTVVNYGKHVDGPGGGGGGRGSRFRNRPGHEQGDGSFGYGPGAMNVPMLMPNTMVPLVPVQLPNGQVGYMVQPGAMGAMPGMAGGGMMMPGSGGPGPGRWQNQRDQRGPRRGFGPRRQPY